MAEKTPCAFALPSFLLGWADEGVRPYVVRGGGTEGPGRFPSHLSKRERWGTRHCFRRPPADLVDGDSDTNRVLSSTSSSDYLHIKGTPGRFSAGRESQR